MNTTNLPMAAAAPATDYEEKADSINDFKISEDHPDVVNFINGMKNPDSEFTIVMNNFNRYAQEKYPEKIDFVDYFEEASKLCFPEMKLGFMSYFAKIATLRKQFVIPHQRLIDFGVISTTNDSYQINRCLTRDNKLIKNVDFTIHQLVERGTTGANKKNIYILTQRAFKICLGRAPI